MFVREELIVSEVNKILLGIKSIVILRRLVGIVDCFNLEKFRVYPAEGKANENYFSKGKPMEMHLNVSRSF